MNRSIDKAATYLNNKSGKLWRDVIRVYLYVNARRYVKKYIVNWLDINDNIDVVTAMSVSNVCDFFTDIGCKLAEEKGPSLEEVSE